MYAPSFSFAVLPAPNAHSTTHVTPAAQADARRYGRLRRPRVRLSTHRVGACDSGFTADRFNSRCSPASSSRRYSPVYNNSSVSPTAASSDDPPSAADPDLGSSSTSRSRSVTAASVPPSKSNPPSDPTIPKPASPIGKHGDDVSQLPAASDSQSQSQTPMVNFQLFGRSMSIPARWLLFSVPFMWGSFGPAVRLIFSNEPHIDAPVFNTARLACASLVYSPILFAEFNRVRQKLPSPGIDDPNETEVPYWRAGLELGIYVFLANVCQVLGLESVSAGRAAFLVQCQTVIVPVLSGILGIEVITRKTWFSSIVAISGVALLSLDKGHGSASSLYGDSLELISAFFFSAYILRLANYCNRVRPSMLVAAKITVQAILSAGWAVTIAVMGHHAAAPVLDGSTGSAALDLPEWTWHLIALNAGVVLWTGLVSSALSGWAQTKGQQLVPASETVVIFATQPLWASAIAALVLGETFGVKGIVGGALIVVSTIIGASGDNEKEKIE